MGFPIGENLLKDMHTLSGLDVVLMLRTPLGDWSVSQSTLERAQWSPVAAAWQSPISGSTEGNALSLMVEGNEFSGHQVVLPVTGLRVERVDLRGVPEQRREEEARRAA